MRKQKKAVYGDGGSSGRALGVLLAFMVSGSQKKSVYGVRFPHPETISDTGFDNSNAGARRPTRLILAAQCTSLWAHFCC